MKQKFSESIAIPEGVSCGIKSNALICRKGSVERSINIKIPNIITKIDSNSIVFACEAGNKNNYKTIKSLIAHANNLFSGIDKEYSYKLEACNVHFPMTFKVEGSKFTINNFLGEKKPRFALILPNVEVDVKGQKITISSHSKEAAGQTAANLEKATKIRNRDRRVFQDGIYIVEKPSAGKD